MSTLALAMVAAEKKEEAVVAAAAVVAGTGDHHTSLYLCHKKNAAVIAAFTNVARCSTAAFFLHFQFLQ